MMNAQVANPIWQRMVNDLDASKVGMFPQADLHGEPQIELAAPSFDELRQSSEVLARAMGRVVRVNPDHTLDVVARVSPRAVIDAYRSYQN